MDWRRSKILFGVFCAVFTAAFAGAGHMMVERFTDLRNHRHATELAEQMLRRAELGVDYAFLSFGKLLEAGATQCEARSMSAMRKQVLSRATIKDIRVLDAAGNTLCAAFPEAMAKGAERIDLTKAKDSSSGTIGLTRLANAPTVSLGVIWRLESERRLAAIVNTSAMLFDILPAALRDHGEAFVELAGSSGHIAHYTPAAGDIFADGAPEAFSARSQRYPLAATIRLDRGAIAAWNRTPKSIPIGIGGLLGLLFGFLAAKTLFREPHPVAAIDRALAAREFVPYYQPLFDLQTGDIVGCEVLVRWVRADGTVAPPYQFIPLAEQTGRIVPMTWQLIDTALGQLRPFLRQNRRFKVAFNFVASHLMSPTFADELRRHVTGARVGNRHIVIELTEREQLPDLDAAADVVAHLHERGFTVAVDDAGTGHSGLSYIQKLGADAIKIDKFFVDSVVGEQSARALIELLVNLAAQLGMYTVAEGVETEDQSRVLRDLGVDRGQGYLVSKPLPGAQFLELLEMHAATRSPAPTARAA